MCIVSCLSSYYNLSQSNEYVFNEYGIFISSSPSHASTAQMAGMSMNNAKNNSYVKEVKILNVNTKIEINPFHSGFNTFKITFTDADGKPYSNIINCKDDIQKRSSRYWTYYY